MFLLLWFNLYCLWRCSAWLWRVISLVIITPYLKRLSICPGSYQIPVGKANCRRSKTLIFYLINTSNEILISIRHGTTLSIVGVQSRGKWLASSAQGHVVAVCVEWGDAWHMSDLQSSCKSHNQCSRFPFFRSQEKGLPETLHSRCC